MLGIKGEFNKSIQKCRLFYNREGGGKYMFLLAIILTLVIFILYHKIFNIAYFGFMPLIKEIVVIFIISLIIIYSVLG